MSSLRTGSLKTAPEPLDDLDGSSLSLPVGDVFERLWHLLISMRTGLALILFLALLTLAGTVLTQAPAWALTDGTSYAQWLDTLRPSYGGWTNVFDALGLFSVFGSIWFKAGVVLLVTSILACSVNRAPRLWHQATRPRLVASPAFLEHAPLAGSVTVGSSSQAAADALVGELRRRHFRTVVTSDAAGTAIYADRFRWGPFGTVVAHLSLILILIGAVLGTTGFRITDFAVPVNSTLPVGHGTNLEVKAVSFSDAYYEDGQPSDYASQLIVYDNGVQVVAGTIRVNQPLRVGDVSIYQSYFGPAVDVLVKGADGATAFQGGVPMPYGTSDGTKRVGSFAIPNSDLTVYVVSVASGRVDPRIKAGQLQFEVYNGPNDQNPDIQVVDQGKPVTIGAYELTFVRELRFTGLIVARDPGAPFVWLGTAFLVLGVVMVFLFPNRRLWARIRGTGAGSEVRIAAATRHDLGFESTFRSVLVAIQEKGR